MVLFCCWAQGPPAHYTFLEIVRDTSSKDNIRARYCDSLHFPAAANLQIARNILINLGFTTAAENLESTNKIFQAGGWECGLFAIKFMEAALRAKRGEPKQRFISDKDLTTRTNEFIKKVKASAKAAPVPKAKVKAQPKPAQKKPEPKHKNLEDALTAAQSCSKCVATKKGTKGCRTCMGEFFEQIRLQQVRRKWLKDIDADIEKGEREWAETKATAYKNDGLVYDETTRKWSKDPDWIRPQGDGGEQKIE